MRSFWTASIMLATQVAVAGSAVEAAPKDRYCATQGGGAPNCAYDTAEQCRNANQGAGRCVPEAWLDKKAPKRVASPKLTDPVEFDRHAVRDLYLGPLGRYGSQEVPQMYNYDSGPNSHSPSSWVGSGSR